MKAQWVLTLVIPLKDLGIHQDSNPQSGNPLGRVWAHLFTLSYTHVNMKCDSQASFLTHTFASLYLGCEPKAMIATCMMAWVVAIFQQTLLTIRLWMPNIGGLCYIRMFIYIANLVMPTNAQKFYHCQIWLVDLLPY